MLRAFLADDRGTETVEWGVMAGLIVGLLVLTVFAIGDWVYTKFDDLNTNIRQTPPPP